MSPDPAPTGRLEVRLAPGQRLWPARVPGADLVLDVRSGTVAIELEPPVSGAGAPRLLTRDIESGDTVALPRGTVFAVLAGAHGATVAVSAEPPGPEAFFELAARRPSPQLGALVAAAVEQGVELLPAGLHAAEEAGDSAR